MRIREFAVPLQALLAMLVCVSLIWMVYTIAFFDPNPPTAAEVLLLETQDSEILVLRTAAAMTVDALLFGPTEILMPVTGSSLTPTPTSQNTQPALSTLASILTATGTPTLRPGTTPTGRVRGNPNLPTATATPRPPTQTSTDAPTIEPSPTDLPTELPTIEPPATDTPTDPTATEPPPVDTPTEPPTTEPQPTEPPTIEPTP